MTLPSLIARAMSKATLDYQIQRKLIPETATTWSSIQPGPSYEALAQVALDTIAGIDPSSKKD